MVGEIEEDRNVFVVRRIHVTYYLRAEAGKRPVVERVLGFHARACPLARSIGGCVEITTSLEFEEI
ncbi:MAG: hypothetical protein ACK2U9_05040 [Anaerolineae bacterium]